MLDHSTRSLLVKMIFLSLERVFGGPRLLESGFLSLVGGSREDFYHGQP
jgi:hypothetical protein